MVVMSTSKRINNIFLSLVPNFNSCVRFFKKKKITNMQGMIITCTSSLMEVKKYEYSKRKDVFFYLYLCFCHPSRCTIISSVKFCTQSMTSVFNCTYYFALPPFSETSLYPCTPVPNQILLNVFSALFNKECSGDQYFFIGQKLSRDCLIINIL